MKPSEVVNSLHHIAAIIENSQSPSRKLVAKDLSKLILKLSVNQKFMDDNTNWTDERYIKETISGIAYGLASDAEDDFELFLENLEQYCKYANGLKSKYRSMNFAYLSDSDFETIINEAFNKIDDGILKKIPQDIIKMFPSRV